MTEQEKQQLVEAVITQLKRDGTDVSKATVVSGADGIAYVLCYDNNNNIVRVTPSTFDGITEVTWEQSSHVDDYIEAGVYDIAGTRWRNDGLPINNMGENATIAAKLFVTVTPEGATTYRHSIGQTLILTNSEGKETKIYTRNGNRTSTDGGVTYTITWGNWGQLQQNIEVGLVASLDSFTNNGIYSGIWQRGEEFITFVCVVINDYALGVSPRRVSQYVYGINKGSGKIEHITRMAEGDTTVEWERDWHVLNEQYISAAVEGIYVDIQTMQEDIVAEFTKVKDSVSETKKDIANQLFATAAADEVTITGRNEQSKRLNFEADIPAATTEKAGVMSAADKVALDTATSRALRALFVTAGAVYNDSSADKTRTAPWGETVTHKAGHYYLNGLGDITEKQMMDIYNAPHNALYPAAYTHLYNTRTLFWKNGTKASIPSPISHDGIFFYNTNLETIGTSANDDSLLYSSAVGVLNGYFRLCAKLKHINITLRIMYIKSLVKMFEGCAALESVRISGLPCNVSFSDSPNISKGSILHAVVNATPTSAITITLHPDAYARLAEDADIVAALNEKNGYIDEEGNEIAGTLPTGASINLVSA